MTGDTGYYRHHDVCDPFRVATAGLRRRPIGESAGIPAPLYDAAVQRLLGRVAVRAEMIEHVVATVQATTTDVAALARIDRERDAALKRYRTDRDSDELTRTMAALDAREEAARSVAPIMSPDEVVA